LWASYSKFTALGVVVELGLALEDTLAAHTLEVIALQMLLQDSLVRAIEITAGL
jgi:hypothetical protein